MSSVPTIRQLDFRIPRRPDVGSARVLQRWLSDATQRLQDRWQLLCQATLTLEPQTVESLTDLTVVDCLPGDGIGFELNLGEEKIPALLVISGRQTRLLLDLVLGMVPEVWPAPAPVTSAEMAVLEILGESCAESLGQGWPGETTLPCQYLGSTDRPQRTKLWPADAPLYLAHIRVLSCCGEDSLVWLIPREPLDDLMDSLGTSKPTDAEESRRRVLNVTQRLPVRFSVEVGRAELSMAAIAGLSEGDVLLLDQSVYRPLIAYVEGRPKYLGHPLTIGSRIAFHISGLVEP